MNRPLLVSFLLLALFVGSPAVLAGPSKDTVKQTIAEFNKEPRSVRPSHPLLPINYTENEGRSYGYYLPRRFVRLAQQGERFTIKKTKYRKRHVLFELLSTHGAKVNVAIWDQQRLSQGFLDRVVPGALQELFEFGAPPEVASLVGNQHSQMVHLRGCNHLPEAASRVELASIQEAQAQGWRLCPACFPREASFPIEGFGPLRNEMVEAARLHELAFPPVVDPQAQADLQSKGESVVQEFPIEIPDFEYTFKLVHSTYPNSVSFYSGFVFVTDALIAMIEDPAELEFVLAHEILHTVQHQPPPPFYPRGTIDLEQQVASYNAALRFRETEADLIGLLWLNRRYGSTESLSRGRGALAKLQFLNEALPVEETSAHASHPSFSRRLEFFDPERFQLNPETERVFCGVDDDGETLVRARVLAKSKDDEATRFYLLVEVTDLMNGPLVPQLGEFEDADGSKRRGRFTGGASEFIPPAGIGVVEMTILAGAGSTNAYQKVVSKPEYFEEFQLDHMVKLEFTEVRDVDHWTLCGD
jgi:hypothetical protein